MGQRTYKISKKNKIIKEKTMDNPKLVLQQVIDNGESDVGKDNNIVHVYPLTIARYAFLELLDSPFINPEKKFELNSVIPAAFVMSHTTKDLRKYNSKNLDTLVADSLEWADDELKLEDVPELIKAIVSQLQALNKAAPAQDSAANSGP